MKESPKTIAIVYRPESPPAMKTACELATWLNKRSLEVWSHPDQDIKCDGKTLVKKLKPKMLKDLDLVIVLGGDGTYLQAVRMLGDVKVPILGINMGSLGFLADIRKEDLYEAVTQTLECKMQMRPRSMLSVRVSRNGKIVSEATALNDIVIERGPFSPLINVAINAEGYLVGEVKADGLVISSPTGSTAYNLAAGGPILHPDVRALVITPVAPHSLTHRPLIFPDNLELSFSLTNKNQRAFLTVDGQNGGEVKHGDEVVISRAKFDHYILRRPGKSYFDLLREKLRFGERV